MEGSPTTWLVPGVAGVQLPMQRRRAASPRVLGACVLSSSLRAELLLASLPKRPAHNLPGVALSVFPVLLHPLYALSLFFFHTLPLFLSCSVNHLQYLFHPRKLLLLLYPIRWLFLSLFRFINHPLSSVSSVLLVVSPFRFCSVPSPTNCHTVSRTHTPGIIRIRVYIKL